MSLKDELVCIGEAEVDSEKMLTKGKGLGVITNKVFMDRGVYKMKNMSEHI
jgi:predicted ribosome-associated RNA-binding protein Tma20